MENIDSSPKFTSNCCSSILKKKEELNTKNKMCTIILTMQKIKITKTKIILVATSERVK